LVSENKSFKDVFFSIADAFEKKRPFKKIKPWQTAVFWRLAMLISRFTGKPPLISKHSAKSAHSISKYSSEKIKKSLNYSFEPLEETVERVCRNYTNI
jgi:phage portal protein BeeE